jgi:hypothetical protein
MSANSDIDSVRYVYSLYPEAAKLKDPDSGEQFCTMQCRRQVENIRLAHSCPENISVKAADSCLPLHSFV